jgi:glycosyltransferase involved in cell wall biosynthesis
MQIRNTTGVPQIAPNGSLLPPGILKSVPGEVSLQDAIWLHSRRMADLTNIEDSSDLLWKSEEGTHLYWLSPFSKGDGYATAADNLVHALYDLDCILEVHQCWFFDLDGLRAGTAEMLNAQSKGLHRVGLCMATPGEFKKLPTPYRIGLTMYESDDPLANMPEWRHDCADVDMLVVPSEYCKDVFSQFVDRPIRVSPLAINPVYMTAKKREPKDTFTFVMYGTLTGRKAPLETLDAFKKAFPRDRYPNVRFEFKTRLGFFGWSENQLPDPDTDDRVKIISCDWYAPQMLDWLHSADAMIFPSKGEGFGMPPREAIATGLPTVITANTGLLPICDDRYTWPVPSNKVGNSPLGGNWYIADWDYLIDVMRSMYENREATYQQGYEAAQWFAREHSPACAGRSLLDIVESVDPTTSALRHNRIPLSVQDTVEDHEAFIRCITDAVPVPGPIWDIGVGDGLLYVQLTKLGYKVTGIVDACNLDTVRSKLEARGVNSLLIACEAGTLYPPSVPNSLIPKACVSLGVFQQLGDFEITQTIKCLFNIVDTLFISVPSVYYPGFYNTNARLMRSAQWQDILSPFAATIHEYGTGNQFYNMCIQPSITAWGPVQRRNGRILQGVWHVNR